jgi:hypothetical protein
MTVKLLTGVCVDRCDKHCNGTEKIRNSKFLLNLNLSAIFFFF